MAALAPTRYSALAFPVALLAVGLFSCMDAVMKALVLDIGLFTTLLWRNAAGAAIAGALFVARGPSWPGPAALRVHLARGAITAGMAALFFWAMARMPMAQAVALAFIAPLLATGLAALTLGERIERRALAASLVALAGVAVIAFGNRGGNPTGGEGEALLATAAVLVSALLYAVNIVLMRQQALVSAPVEVAFFQSLTVAIVLAAVVPILGVVLPPAHALGPILLAAALATASLLLFGWAYARGTTGLLSTSEYSAFPWSAAFGFLVFGERLTLWTMAGAALIVGACLLAARLPAPGAEGAL